MVHSYGNFLLTIHLRGAPILGNLHNIYNNINIPKLCGGEIKPKASNSLLGGPLGRPLSTKEWLQLTCYYLCKAPCHLCRVRAPNYLTAPCRLQDDFRHTTDSFIAECCKSVDPRPFLRLSRFWGLGFGGNINIQMSFPQEFIVQISFNHLVQDPGSC